MNRQLEPRQQAVLDAALAAAEPAAAVRAHMRRRGSRLVVGERDYDLDAFERLIVLGAGKAGAPMVQAVEALLGDRIDDGCVVVKYGHQGPAQRVRILQAAHPVPDQAGLDAGAELLALAAGAGERDLVICVLSGGGSALLESLPPPITLADLQATTDLLLASGAHVREINILRKHISLVKGGQLARAAHPATLIALVLSDVVGSPLASIASGPTVPDPSTAADAWAVVERYELGERLPAAVAQRLTTSAPGTPKPGDPVFERCQTLIIGDNAQAAAAAASEAARQGYNALILSTFVEGEAQVVGQVAAAIGREAAAYGRPVSPPACIILGGETTVTLGEGSGTGGRNQELALAAAIALAGQPGVTLVALATDGTDGPTDAAGGVVDGRTVARGAALGLDARAHLAAHDAYPFLEACGALLKTGPTRTNVNDLIFVFVETSL